MRIAWMAFALLLTACSGARVEGKSTAAAQVAGTPAEALGLSRTSVFDIPEPRAFEYADDSGKRLERPWHGAPPRPPHDIQGYLPITQKNNDCLGCHGAESTDDAPALPQSHFIDYRNAPGVVRKEPAGTRYVCTACHVPHANVPTLP